MRRVLSWTLLLVLALSLLTGCGQKELSDGTYLVEVTLSGGSGRATVESPVKVVIADGQATATIVWSSPFYEYMLVNQVRYDPIQTQGNSTFAIPVVLGEKLPVSASTVAMSQPHLVDYELDFTGKVTKEEGK